MLGIGYSLRGFHAPFQWTGINGVQLHIRESVRQRRGLLPPAFVEKYSGSSSRQFALGHVLILAVPNEQHASYSFSHNTPPHEPEPLRQ